MRGTRQRFFLIAVVFTVGWHSLAGTKPGAGSAAVRHDDLPVAALRLHFARSLGGFSTWLMPLVLAFLLLGYFDVLTAVAAVFTYVLWTLNYSTAALLRDIGNTAHWAVWGAWLLAAASAGAIAFRAPLLRALRREQA